MSKSLRRVRAALESAGVRVEILEMPGGTRTAADAAREAGCEIDQIAKSILFLGAETGDVHLFITAGGRQVVPEAASGLVGEPLERADASTVRAATGFAIGGVAPIGHLKPPRAFWDPRLSDFRQVWAAAGTPRHIFAIEPHVLRQISGAQPVDFAS